MCTTFVQTANMDRPDRHCHSRARCRVCRERPAQKPWESDAMRVEWILVLVSGPYLSGTDGDEAKIRANLARMEAMSLPLFEKGHLATVGEWLAWPVIAAAGGDSHQSEEFARYQYPVAHRLLAKCDAVLRIPGASRGADLECDLAREMGKPVYLSIDEVPSVPDQP